MQHSVDLQRLYAECCAECERTAAVKSRLANLRAAKHRIETFTTPLSRCLLNLDGLLSFCMKTSLLRRGTAQGDGVDRFMTLLNDELLLTAALMCDAGNETMNLIRAMDTDDMSVAELNQDLKEYLARIRWLFDPTNPGVRAIPGHTAYILDWLSKPHFLTENRRGGKCLGGTPIADDVFAAALKRMHQWAVLVRDIVAAEFPCFSIINAFSAFSLSAPSASAERDTNLQRLALACNEQNLMEQFATHVPWASACQGAPNAAKGSHWQIWADAISKTRKQGRLPSDSLATVLQKGICFAPTTSAIEQSFSRLAQRLPSQRLHSKPERENQSIRLPPVVQLG